MDKVPRHTAATSASVFYTFDERGNVAQRLDAGGGLLSTDLYDAFGARTGTAPAGDPWGFGAQWGYQTDAETGLVLCTNRYYDPQQGRFLTRDPLGYAGGVNLYGYTQNNPANNIDPTGFGLEQLQQDAMTLPPGVRNAAEIALAAAALGVIAYEGLRNIHLPPVHFPTIPWPFHNPTQTNLGPSPYSSSPMHSSGPPVNWPATHEKIPGGPWVWYPNDTNSRGGAYRGPVTKGATGPAGRPELTYGKDPRGAAGYWKCNRPGGVEDRYDPEGNPLEENDPGHSPSGGRK